MVDDMLAEKNYFNIILAMTRIPVSKQPPRYRIYSIRHSGPGGEVRISPFLSLLLSLLFPLLLSLLYPQTLEQTNPDATWRN